MITVTPYYNYMESRNTTLKDCSAYKTLCVVCAASYRSCATNLRRSLHWLLIWERIVFKIATIPHKVRFHRQLSYLSDLIVEYILVRLLR